jgi:hypothetical protein
VKFGHRSALYDLAELEAWDQERATAKTHANGVEAAFDLSDLEIEGIEA